MGTISSYCLSVICINAAAAILTSLFPDTSGAKKHLKFLCGVCICAAATTPLIKLTTDIGDLTLTYNLPQTQVDSTNERYRELVIDRLREDVEEYVVRLVENKFDVTGVSCKVELNDGEDGVSLEGISINMNGGDFMRSDVKRYVEQQFECETVVEGSDEDR